MATPFLAQFAKRAEVVGPQSYGITKPGMTQVTSIPDDFPDEIFDIIDFD